MERRIGARSAKAIKVIYIAGTGRSGSTLLDTLLGGMEGFFSGGELLRLWYDGLIRLRLCGCGERLVDCSVWHEIVARVEAGLGSTIDAHAVVGRQERLLTLRNLPRLLRGRDGIGPDLQDHIRLYSLLYGSIAAVTGARVVVDSSKRPQQAAVLPLIGSIEPYLVHIVRDPRAVAWSMQKRVRMQPQSESDPMEMARSSPAKSARLWLKWNAAIELARRGFGRERTRRVRYEDLMASPAETVADLVEWVGEPVKGLEFVSGRTVLLGRNHSAWGNPSRFLTGYVDLRRDDEWLTSLSRTDRITSTLVTLPLLTRYGYDTRAAIEGRAADRDLLPGKGGVRR